MRQLEPGLVWLPFALAPGALELDFTGPARVDLVTQVLACCARTASGEPPDADCLWGLEVGQRTLYLAGIAAEAAGVAGLEVVLACANAACKGQIEVELTTARLAEFQAEAHAEEQLSLETGGQVLALRRPTGDDQRCWTAAGTSVGPSDVLRDLLVAGDPDLSEAAVQRADAALQEFDPLVDFNCEVLCPYCGETHSYGVDLEQVALGRLRLTQYRLFEEVDRLAACYAWSEAEILALPAWRRRRYLQIIERREEQ